MPTFAPAASCKDAPNGYTPCTGSWAAVTFLTQQCSLPLMTTIPTHIAHCTLPPPTTMSTHAPFASPKWFQLFQDSSIVSPKSPHIWQARGTHQASQRVGACSGHAPLQNACPHSPACADRSSRQSDLPIAVLSGAHPACTKCSAHICDRHADSCAHSLYMLPAPKEGLVLNPGTHCVCARIIYVCHSAHHIRVSYRVLVQAGDT
jgi:hypothetical protein